MELEDGSQTRRPHQDFVGQAAPGNRGWMKIYSILEFNFVSKRCAWHYDRVPF
jgi:hypothetical protein